MWWVELLTGLACAAGGSVTTALIDRRRDTMRAAKRELVGIHAEMSNAQSALSVVSAQIEGVNQRVTDVWAALAALERSSE